MPTTATAPPRTARALLALVECCGPTAGGGELGFDTAPPAEYDAALEILHTGVRAVLTGRAWYGCGSERASAGPRVLDPGSPVPRGITLLAVEGDACWDRIAPSARLDLPHLFEREPSSTIPPAGDRPGGTN